MRLNWNKKTLIIIASLLAAAAVFTTAVLVLNRKGQGVTGRPLPRILVNVPEFQEEYKNFHSRLLHDFRQAEGIYSLLYEFPSQEYLETSEQRFSGEGLGDLYYFVNTRKIDDLFKEGKIQDLQRLQEQLTHQGLPDKFLSINRSGVLPYVPVSWYPWGIYYHKSEFRDLDLKEPDTYDEFLDLCGVLQSQGRQPFLVSDAIQWPSTVWFDYLDIRMNGAGFHEEWMNLDIPLNSPEVRDVFTAYRELVRTEIVAVLEGDSDSWEGMVEAFREDRASLLLCGDFLYDKLSDKEKQDLGWFPFPVIDRQEKTGEIISSAGYVVSEMAPNPEPLEKFLAYVVSPRGQEVLISGGGYLPVNKNLIRTLKRPDAIKGYERALQADKLFAFSNRGADPRIIYPFKMTFVLILNNPGEEALTGMLDKLERLRVEILEKTK